MRRPSFSRGQWEVQRERLHLDREEPFPTDRSCRLSDVLPGLMKKLGLGEQVLQHALLEEWERLVGPQVAKHTRPGRLEGKVLWIFVDSSPWLNELSRYAQKEILANLQQRFGPEIRSIRLQLDPDVKQGR